MNKITSKDDIKNHRICFVSPRLYLYFFPEEGKAAGGSQRQQYLLSKKLAEMNVDVSIATGGDHKKNEDVNSIEIWRGCPESISSITHTPLYFLQLFSCMRKIECDIFYIRGTIKLLIPTLLISNFLGKKTIFCVANDVNTSKKGIAKKYGFPYNIVYPLALKRCSAVIAQSHKQKSQLSKEFNIKSTVIPNGYSIPCSEDLINHLHRKTVLWVGTSDESQKQPSQLLETAEILSDIKFTMICRPRGDLKYHSQIKNRAMSLPNVEFIEGVSPESIHAYFNQAALLVNTSKYEGFPNTFLEAWRYATPVVSLHFDLDGVLSGCSVGRHSGSFDKFIEDILHLYNNPQIRAQMGNKGRKMVDQKYSLDKVANSYLEILSDI